MATNNDSLIINDDSFTENLKSAFFFKKIYLNEKKIVFFSIYYLSIYFLLNFITMGFFIFLISGNNDSAIDVCLYIIFLLGGIFLYLFYDLKFFTSIYYACLFSVHFIIYNCVFIVMLLIIKDIEIFYIITKLFALPYYIILSFLIDINIIDARNESSLVKVFFKKLVLLTTLIGTIIILI